MYRNIIKTACALSLVGASYLYAADNEIDVKATVAAGAMIGFVDTSSETIAANTYTFKDATGASGISLGTFAPGDDPAAVDKDIFVQANNGSGLNFKLVKRSGSGMLQQSGQDDINCTYELKQHDGTFVSVDIGAGTTVAITSGDSDGKSAVSALKIDVNAIPSGQGTGDYVAELKAEISSR